jgi:tetratricopeptide (TPR) repeat protein
MDSARHAITREPIDTAGSASTLLALAESMENTGNWYLAGETYRQADHAGVPEKGIRAKLLARAAVCFEVASQHRAAAHAYFDAASSLADKGVRLRDAGELFNRAALQFRQIDEDFNAGDSWRRAGLAFTRVCDAVLFTSENIPPVPMQAGKFSVAGACYTAAGDAFSLTGDEAKWACMAYWEAGKAHSDQGHGYHAFVAYRKALTAAIRFYGTHDLGTLRRCLPLTEEERAAKVDPISVMEGEAFRGYRDHQRINAGVLNADWVRHETDRQMTAAFHEFHLAFAAIGNAREAGVY